MESDTIRLKMVLIIFPCKRMGAEHVHTLSITRSDSAVQVSLLVQVPAALAGAMLGSVVGPIGAALVPLSVRC